VVWLGQRYGRVSRRRVSLSFQERNLTHRQRAEIADVTRVTVTQALSHYRQAGMMVRAGNDELLMGEGLSLRPATIHRAGRCARGHAGRRTRRRADHR
jgi:hypothetical protein